MIKIDFILPNKCGVYKIENTLNKKVYVGSSQGIRVRKNNHMSRLRNNKHHNTHLQFAFNKYGEHCFKFHVLEICNLDILEEREHYWIKELKANNNKFGYNARIYVTNNRGFRHSEETKLKISKNRKGKTPKKYHISQEMRKYKAELCKAQNPAQYHTEETEEKRLHNLRKAICGQPISIKHKDAISEANRGEGNGMAKLTEAKVIEIKTLIKDNPQITQTKIAEMFNVSRRTIGMIGSGDRWGHITV